MSYTQKQTPPKKPFQKFEKKFEKQTDVRASYFKEEGNEIPAYTEEKNGPQSLEEICNKTKPVWL